MRPTRRNRRPQANSLSQGLDKALFKTLFWNAGGLTLDKFTELLTLVHDYDADIFSIVEAGASTDSIDDFQVPGYQTFVLGRARQVASGIIVAVKSSLVADFKIVKEFSSNDKLEAVEISVWKASHHRRFFVIYNPPKNKPDLTWLESTWGRGCVLYGDLNAPSRAWGYSTTDPIGRVFEDFVAANPVTHVENENCEPTFLSYAGRTSHPDVVLCHPAEPINPSNTLIPPPGGFGHSILLVKLFSTMHVLKANPTPRWNKRKADWKKYKDLAEQSITDDILTAIPERSVDNVTDSIWRCALQALPRGSMRRYTPFWNDTLSNLRLERNIARANVFAHNTDANRIQLRQKAAKMKREVTAAKESSIANFLSKHDFRRDGTKTHQYVSNLKNQHSASNKPLKIGSKVLTSEKDIAEGLCKHYTKISNYRPSKRNGRPNTSLPPTCENEEESRFLSAPLDCSELDFAIGRIKNGRSAGPDELLPEFLTHLGPKARTVLLKLFQQIWDSHFPSQWRKAEVIPVKKKGKRGDAPEDFRPISLTCALSKLYERILVRRLEQLLEMNKGLKEQQAGFRRHRNTVEQVVWLSQSIKDGFHRKQSTLAIFIDFRTAFDRVWRKKLQSKLISKGITGRLFKNVSSFLTQRFIRVKYKEATSRYRQLKQGLPQGSVISPLLFNIMIDDVIDAVQSVPGVSALLYADDLVCWATSSSIPALETCLNEVLERLAIWSSENEMLLHPCKSQFQLFSLSTKNHSISLKYKGETVPRTEEAVYLGVKMDTRLTWNKHIEKQAEQASSRLTLLKRLAGIKWGATQDVLSLAYKAFVRPVAEYGSEVTITASATALHKLDIVQNQALRLVTGGPKSTPIDAMEMQTNTEPLWLRREFLALSLYERVNRLGMSYWDSYRPASNRLQTQKNFTSAVSHLARDVGLQTNNRLKFPRATDHQVVLDMEWRLHLIRPVSKEVTLPAELKAVALATLAQLYPEEEWLRVYTDGSAQNSHGNSGAGVFSSHFSISQAVGTRATNFVGELKAIELALNELCARSFPQVVILVDSQAAILSVVGNEVSDVNEVLRTRELLNSLRANGTRVVLQWIPSHCGIRGNEEADRLAKMGANKEQPVVPVSYQEAKLVAKSALLIKMKSQHHQKAEGKQWEALCRVGGTIPADLPREQSVACFRLLTGHDYLGKHLHRIGIYPHPNCTLCDTAEEMSGDHLDVCPALEDERGELAGYPNLKYKSALYWAARRRMALVASVPA